ncbi:MAG: hypothetical protein EP311_09830 [Cytophagales bacterium]|nr:MAG: hypothetical protein EP311_09830 [Cytophagales bacterium]
MKIWFDAGVKKKLSFCFLGKTEKPSNSSVIAWGLQIPENKKAELLPYGYRDRPSGYLPPLTLRRGGEELDTIDPVDPRF